MSPTLKSFCSTTMLWANFLRWAKENLFENVKIFSSVSLANHENLNFENKSFKIFSQIFATSFDCFMKMKIQKSSQTIVGKWIIGKLATGAWPDVGIPHDACVPLSIRFFACLPTDTWKQWKKKTLKNSKTSNESDLFNWKKIVSLEH